VSPNKQLFREEKMPDGSERTSFKTTGPCLRAAISRVFSRKKPDDEDLIEKHESSLKGGWHTIRASYEKGHRIESMCPRSKKQSILVPHNIEGMCDLFAFVALEGRAFRILDEKGILTMIGPFTDKHH